MTSKEALEEIKDYGLVTYDEEGNEEDCITFGELEPNLIEAIEKDLEVLEILKYLIFSIERTFNLKTFHESGMLGTHVKDYFIDNDITGKVEEWLKNE